ncbi:MAG: hypothetical protein SF187_18630 [Deltaproteobacteria bacterium]|nr:hypothetical protein [Deltaproteobacteria bacterium]
MRQPFVRSLGNLALRHAVLTSAFAAAIACGPAPSDSTPPGGGNTGGSSSAGGSSGNNNKGGLPGTSGTGAMGGSSASANGGSMGSMGDGSVQCNGEPGTGALSDFEGGTAKLLELEGRTGSWFLYDDGTAGGTQMPAKVPNMPLAAEGPGACNSMFAFHSTGSGFDSWAGVGVNLAPKASNGKKGVQNISAYSSISFRAKAANPVLVRVAISDKNSEPEGGVCTVTTVTTDKTRCADHFGKEITIGSGWKDYTIPFAQLSQRGFGLAVPSGLDKNNAITLFFQARAQGTAKLSYDLWLDDVRFVK